MLDGEQQRQRLLDAVQRRRAANGVLLPDGTLDVAVKLERSAYDVLTREYYALNASTLEGVGDPPQPTDEELREFYLLRTQKLVDRAVEHDADVVVYLDKSARPVAWLVRALWAVFAPAGRPAPAALFLSFDANTAMGRGPDHTARPTEQEVADYRPPELLVQQVAAVHRSCAPWGSVRRGLVVDEVSVSGATGRLARSVLAAAHPGVEFSAEAWMSGGLVTTGRRGHESRVVSVLPPWYSKHFDDGRGRVTAPTTCPVVSSRMSSRDLLGEALRTDVQLLALDVARCRQSLRGWVEAYEVDPLTGRRDLERPARYKLSRLDRAHGDRRVVALPATSRSGGSA